MTHAISGSKHTTMTLLAAGLLAASALLAAPAVHAAVPTTSVLEGFLSSTGGGAVADGLYDVTFAIYNVQINGSAAWTEGPLKVEVKGGRFTHALGSGKPLSAAVLDQLSVGWLSMKIGTDPELPRQRLRSVAYALLADTAKALACSGCITNIAIADKTIGAAKVGFNYADSATKGGPAKSAADLSCTNCVSVDELKIDKTLDLGGNALKAKAVAADTVTAGVFKGSGAELTGIKIPTGECPVKGQVVYGIDGDGKLKCVAAVALAALPADGIDEISNNLIHNQFENEDCIAKAVPIADNDPTGVDTVITFGNYGLAQKLEVLIDVKNSDTANLTIKIWDPKNVEYLLWKSSKPGTALSGNWPTTHTTVSGDLTTWVNKNPQGKWRLQVIDHKVHPQNADPDGEISKFCVKIKTLSNQKVQVKGDLIVDGSISSPGGIDIKGSLKLGPTAKACDANSKGTLRWDNVWGLQACTTIQDTANKLTYEWAVAKTMPVIWSGGCKSHGRNSSWLYYCFDGVDYNTAADYLTATGTTVTFKRSGYYRVNYWGIAYSTSHQEIEGFKSGNRIFYIHDYKWHGNGYWNHRHFDQTWHFKKGDTFRFRINSNSTSYYNWHSWSASGSHSRFQVTYVGPLVN